MEPGQVVGQCGQGKFDGDFGQAAPLELAHSSMFFQDGKHGLD